MRKLLKALLFVTAALIMSPLTLSFFVVRLFMKGDSLLSGYSQLLSLLPGKAGSYLRGGFYRFVLTHYSPESVVSFLALFSQQDTEIASGVYIGPQCNIGRSSIGQDTLLGSGVHIMSGKGQHNFDDLDRPIREQGGHFEKVYIGQNCWLGNGTLVMANIGDNCIVGAGSVVTKELPPNSIAHGNPCKVIRSRIEAND